jgi:hypothetical protein
MEIAHFILAHNRPKQLERLINRLIYPGAAIYIHLDKKTPVGPFEHLLQYPSVHFVKKRVKVTWGAANMFNAIINTCREIRQAGKDFKFINLLSAQDYPLQSQKYIHDFLSRHQHTAFMNFEKFDPDWTEAFSRTNQYHFNDFNIPGIFFFQRIVNKLTPPRVFPLGLTLTGRSTWFTLPAEHVYYMIDYWDSNAKLRSFVKLTWSPDEYLFHTILYNSKYSGNMVNDNLRFIKWEPGKVNPNTLTVNNIEEILSSGKLFARKFDINTDEKVLDLIDEHISGKAVSI